MKRIVQHLHLGLACDKFINLCCSDPLEKRDYQATS